MIKNIVTQEALSGTIICDEMSRYWFTHALLTPRLSTSFAHKPQITVQLNTIRQINHIERILFFLAVPPLLSAAIILHRLWPLLLLLALLVSIRFLEQVKGKIVAPLAWQWLTAEFTPEQLASLTLFQISERLAIKHKIISLIDVITRWDWQLREWMLICYVIGAFILFLNLITFVIIFLITFLACKLFLEQSTLHIEKDETRQE